MKHFFIDKYSEVKSPIRNLDARAKIITFFSLILLCVTTPPKALLAFGGYYLILAIMLVISKVPLSFILKRVVIAIPFILMVAAFIPFIGADVGGSYNLWGITLYQRGLLILFNVTVKALFGVAALTLLVSTTPFDELMEGLKKLGVPKVFITIASFMYRYIFVVVDETMRMKRARDSRNFEGRWIWQASAVGHMVATLFLRSYERGERVYSAMLSRGYDGEVKSLSEHPITRKDIIFTLFIISTAVLLNLSYALIKLFIGG
ncbi:MAG TPA: cobalt ECF transporter T component CbiQ [Actinobacteria bacterium]|nr:cobalt ECF transporter T component CbiQ [Actinomycetota bacterium]